MDIPKDYLKEGYFKMMSDKLSLNFDDLTDNEKILIEFGYTIFMEKIEDIRLLNKENVRLSIDLSNLKSYLEDLEDERRKNEPRI